MTTIFHTPRATDMSLSDPDVANIPFNQLDTAIKALGQKIVVVDKDLTAPPGSPSNGAVYIPKVTATGLWTGLENTLAFTNDDGASWVSISPIKGLKVYVTDEALPYEWNGSAWVLAGRYVIGGSFNGIPGDGVVLVRHQPIVPIVFPAGLTGTGSNFYGKTAATAEAVFTLKKNGSEFGTLTIAASGTVATIAVTSATSFAVTDEFTIENQATKDVTFADIGLAIVGIKS